MTKVSKILKDGNGKWSNLNVAYILHRECTINCRVQSRGNVISTVTKIPQDQVTHPMDPTKSLVDYINKLKDASHRENMNFIEPSITK